MQEERNELGRTIAWLVLLSVFCGGGFYAYYRLGMSAARQGLPGVAKAPGPPFTEAQLAAIQKDASALKEGGSIYSSRCAVCHGDKGQGLVGPNLTDDFWLHGNGHALAIAAVIDQGVPVKGMPAWSSVLVPKEIADVTAYVRSLRGTSPPAPKDPQGERYPR